MEIDGMGADAERRSRRAVIALALGTGGAAFVAASSETAASTAIVPGPTGPAGATGPIGATGPRGATGATGAVGARGAPGRDGVGATGAAGPPGATGVSGHAGMQGIPGTAGTAGVMGPAHVQFIYRQRSDTIPADQASHTASYACDTGEQAIGARYGGLPSGWRVNLAGLGHPIDPTLADTYTMSAVGYSRDADSELFVYLTCMQIQTI